MHEGGGGEKLSGCLDKAAGVSIGEIALQVRGGSPLSGVVQWLIGAAS